MIKLSMATLKTWRHHGPQGSLGDEAYLTRPAAATPRWRVLLALAVVASVITAAGLQRSFAAGRLATPLVPLYDDVSYFHDGLDRLDVLRREGLRGMVAKHAAEPPHSPWSSYLALIAYACLGRNAWAPYALNFVVVFAMVGAVHRALRNSASWAKWPLIALAATFPFADSLVEECRPDPMCAVVTVAGLWCLGAGRVALLTTRQAAWAGVCAGAALWVKPSVFMQTIVLFSAALGWSWLLEWREKPRQWRAFWRNAATTGLVACVMAAPHFAFTLPRYLRYMWHNMFGSQREFWASQDTLLQRLGSFTVGTFGQALFGSTFILLSVLVLGTFLVIWWQGNRALTREIGSLIVLAFPCWLLPTVNPVQTHFFGMTFAFLCVVLSLRCLAAWLGGECTLPFRLGQALGVVLVLAVLWQWQPSPAWPWAASPVRHDLTETTNAVYQEIRDRTPAPHIQVFMPTTGHLNLHLLQCRFRLEGIAPPVFLAGSLSKDLDYHRQVLSMANLAILPEPGSTMAHDLFTPPELRTALLEHVGKQPEFTCVSQVYDYAGKRIAIFERDAAFVGWADNGGWHVARKVAAQLTPIASVRVPPSLRRGFHVELKMSASVPGRTLRLRHHDEEFGKWTLSEANTWYVKTLNVRGAQPMPTLEFVTDAKESEPVGLTFERIRLTSHKEVE